MGLSNWLLQRARRRGRVTGPPPQLPAEATFRRAVGLELQLSLCEGLAHVEVTASRQEGATTVSLPLEEVALLFRLSNWQQSDELNVPQQRLASLVYQNLLYWSERRPSRVLTGAPVHDVELPLVLRRNVWPTPVLARRADGARKRDAAPTPFMPRMGKLDDVELAGVRFEAVELDRQTHGISFSCCAAHGMVVRDWLTSLDGKHGCGSLVQTAEHAALLRAFNSLGLLETSLPHDQTWHGESRVTWLGHAAVLVETLGQRILVDPLFHPCSIPSRAHPELPPDPAHIGPLDAILITHGDNDHFNPQALVRLERHTPVYIPRVKAPQAYHVDMLRVLDLLGFTQVHTLQVGDRVQLGDVTVVATPFVGEDWGLSLPQLTYVIQSEPLTVFLNADSHRMDEHHRQIGEEFKVDVAFVGVSGCAETHAMAPGFGCGNFYGPWMPSQKANQWIELSAGPEDAARAAHLVGATKAFGYAAGGASYIPMGFSDHGTHADMAKALEARNSATKAWAPLLGVPEPAGR